jgi:hypothetical protein
LDEPNMQTVTSIGLDIAKVFEVHGVDAGGVVVRRLLKRRRVIPLSAQANIMRAV